jgi:hypothetical protein
MQRNVLYAALQNQLTALTAAPYLVQTVSRGFKMWDQSDAQPAVYIVPVTEDAIFKRNMPMKWLIRVELYVYVKWVDSVQQGVTALANVMDGIDLYLSPTGPNGGFHSDNGVVNNLGGLAQYCALSGPAEISGGFLGNEQTIARMAVEIMVA